MKTFTPDEWYALAKNLYEAISFEMDQAIEIPDPVQVYPKLVVAHEFFRLIRGELFTDLKLREPIVEKQRELYRMEDELLKKLDAVRAKLNLNDDRVGFYLDKMRKSFE